MKKFITAITLVVSLVAVSSAFALSISSVGFRAYSSNTPVSCAILGGTMNVDSSFTPALATNISLGTKGSGTYTPATDHKDYKVYCYSTAAAATAATVKMFFNGSEATIFPVSNAVFKLSR